MTRRVGFRERYLAATSGGEPEDFLPEAPDLEDIAKALGGAAVGNRVSCPSPGCEPDDRSMVVIFNDPSRPWIYGCSGPLAEARRHVYSIIGKLPASTEDRSGYALRIWGESIPGPGTLVQTYLRSRAITLPVPDCLRFHPALRHRPSVSTRSAMVAARTDAEGRMVAIHRTWLRRDGKGKAPIDTPRMDQGPCIGTAIRLAPVALELLIGEGIETSLSAMQVTGRPAWAAGSAVALQNLILPDEVTVVTILADGDLAGEQAALAAARRWRAEKRKVKIAWAPRGQDFNDILMTEAGLCAK